MLCGYIIFTKCDSVPIRNQQSLSSQEQKESEEEKTLPPHAYTKPRTCHGSGYQENNFVLELNLVKHFRT